MQGNLVWGTARGCKSTEIWLDVLIRLNGTSKQPSNLHALKTIVIPHSSVHESAKVSWAWVQVGSLCLLFWNQAWNSSSYPGHSCWQEYRSATQVHQSLCSANSIHILLAHTQKMTWPSFRLVWWGWESTFHGDGKEEYLLNNHVMSHGWDGALLST